LEVVGDKNELARAYYNLGVLYTKTGNFDASEEYRRKALEIAEKIGSLLSMAYQLNGLAYIYILAGRKLKMAEEYLNRAMDIFERLNIKRYVGGCMDTYALLFHKRREWDKCVEYFEKSVKILKEINDLDSIADTYYDYGRCLLDMGKRKKAREKFIEAIECYRKLGNERKVREIKEFMERMGIS